MKPGRDDLRSVESYRSGTSKSNMPLGAVFPCSLFWACNFDEIYTVLSLVES